MGAKTWYIAESGEPLMHKGIEGLIDYANSVGIWVVMATNGSLLSDKIAKDWLKKGVSIQTKVHSLKPENYAKIAGLKEAKFAEYNKEFLPHGLVQLLKHGYHRTIPSRAGIQAVMLKQNIGELPEILRLGRRHGLFVHFERLMIEGYAKNNLEIIPSEKEIGSLLAELAKIDSEEFGFKPEYSAAHFGFKKACGIRLRYHLVIGSTGNAKVCYSNAPELDIGMSIRKHSLKEIQEKKLELVNWLPKGCVCMHYSNLKK